MSDQPQPFVGEEYVDKARDAAQNYAQDNPDQARSLIDRVEDFVDEKTGSRFTGAVDTAGDWAERQLNLPSDAVPPAPPADGETPSEPPAPPAPQDPAEHPSDPVPNEQPRPSDPLDG